MSQSGSRLGAIGVDPLHERVYRYLVRSGQSRTPGEVAVQFGITTRVATSVLRKLESQALIIKVDTRPPGYVVSPPELALESLVARKKISRSDGGFGQITHAGKCSDFGRRPRRRSRCHAPARVVRSPAEPAQRDASDARLPTPEEDQR